MTTHLVLTVIGKDKPGLVESLSQVIVENSGNWLEGSMCQLAGKFAGILRVSVNDKDTESLIDGLNGLSKQLKVVIERVDTKASDEIPSTVKLNLVGNDRPGIIREISHGLSKMAVNVAQLTTECIPAPMAGDTLFKAEAQLQVPQELNLERLKRELEQLADDLIVEIQLD